MSIKKYFKSLDDMIFQEIRLNDKKIKLHLITPYHKKYKSSFTLVIEGYSFLRLKGINGAIMYEFLKETREIQSYDDKSLANIATKVSNTLTEYFPLILAEDMKKSLYDMLDEIAKRLRHEKNDGILKDVNRYSYTMHYQRAFGIRVLKNFDFTNLKRAYDTFKLLKKNNIFVVEYDNECYNKNSYLELLSLNKTMYQALNVKDSFPLKELGSLKNNGLDSIILDIDTIDPKTLGITKETTSFVKAVISNDLRVIANIHVETESIDYLKIIKELHNLGVYSFNIYVNDHLIDKEVIFKRLYFYMNMYHFDISLNTNSVIPQKEAKRMNMNLGYQEEGVSWYYLGNNDGLFLDSKLDNPCGNINHMTLEECFLHKNSKKERKIKKLRVK